MTVMTVMTSPNNVQDPNTEASKQKSSMNDFVSLCHPSPSKYLARLSRFGQRRANKTSSSLHTYHTFKRNVGLARAGFLFFWRDPLPALLLDPVLSVFLASTLLGVSSAVDEGRGRTSMGGGVVWSSREASAKVNANGE